MNACLQLFAQLGRLRALGVPTSAVLPRRSFRVLIVFIYE